MSGWTVEVDTSRRGQRSSSDERGWWHTTLPIHLYITFTCVYNCLYLYLCVCVCVCMCVCVCATHCLSECLFAPVYACVCMYVYLTMRTSAYWNYCRGLVLWQDAVDSTSQYCSMTESVNWKCTERTNEIRSKRLVRGAWPGPAQPPNTTEPLPPAPADRHITSVQIINFTGVKRIRTSTVQNNIVTIAQHHKDSRIGSGFFFYSQVYYGNLSVHWIV